MASIQPPKDGLVRAVLPGLEVRAKGDEGKMPTLHGYFLRFNEDTEIDSLFEGRFIERIAPGAAKKTLEESGDAVRILYNHGHDPSIGEKPLTAPNLREDEQGVYYEGELFDTSYNRDLIPALEAGQLGASFKFRVIQESINEEPERSEANPDGIPERTITELKLYEGGPVTFPAYDGATAGLRSRTGEDVLARWVERNPEHVKGLLARTELEAEPPETALQDEPVHEDRDSTPEGAETDSHSTAGSRAKALYGATRKTPSWRL